jgi:hypothetical protein
MPRKTDDPLYKVNGEPSELHQVGAQLYYGGSTVRWRGWLRDRLLQVLIPINEPAMSVHRYCMTNSQLPNLDTPFDSESSIYLPAFPGWPPTQREPWLPLWGCPEDEVTGAPIYRVTVSEMQIGPPRRSVGRGDEFAFIAWPDLDRMAPVNEAATRVVDYLQRHGEQTDLPPSPWNSWTGALHLPRLTEQPRRAESARLRTTPIGKMHRPVPPEGLLPTERELWKSANWR